MSFVRPLSRAAALAAIASGCSLVTSFDGLTSDGALTPTGDDDAGNGAIDGASGTTLHDAAVSDSHVQSVPDGAPNDALGSIDVLQSSDAVSTVDAPPPIDSGPLGFCASLSPKPVFCDDFDESSTFGKWDSTGGVKGTDLLSTLVVRSAPNAVVASSSAISSGSADLGLYKAFPTITSTPRISTFAFDVYLEKVDTTHGAVAVIGALLVRDNSNALYESQFVIAQTNGKLVATFPEYWDPGNGSATGFVDHAVTAPIALQTWTHIAIEHTLSNGNGTGNAARLLFDGTAVATIAINVITHNGSPQAALGMSYISSPSDAWVVHYDNATFDSTP